MKKVLVMGGNQFLGKAVARKLLELNYCVYVLNRETRKNIIGVNVFKCDRNNKTELEKIAREHYFDVVIDISAYTLQDVKIFKEVLKGRYLHYIFISSASIYKDVVSYPVKEESLVGANSIWGEYAENKYLAENYIKENAKKNNYKYTILRPFYIYGPENNLDRESYIFSRIKNNLPIFVPGSGSEIIQLGYIDDLVNAIIYSFEKPQFYNEIFNISGEESVTIRKYIEICGEILSKEVRICNINLENEQLKARDWFPFRNIHLFGSIDKIKNTNFKVETDLRKGLNFTYDYLEKNRKIDFPLINDIERSLQEKYSGNQI